MSTRPTDEEVNAKIDDALKRTPPRYVMALNIAEREMRRARDAEEALTAVCSGKDLQINALADALMRTAGRSPCANTGSVKRGCADANIVDICQFCQGRDALRLAGRL
jgi:hypothetical protein